MRSERYTASSANKYITKASVKKSMFLCIGEAYEKDDLSFGGSNCIRVAFGV